MNQFFLCLCSCARGCSCGSGVNGFQGQPTVHELWHVRMVVNTRTRVGCTCAEEVGRKRAELCMYFVLYFSRLGRFQEESSVDWADSKSSVQYI